MLSSARVPGISVGLPATNTVSRSYKNMNVEQVYFQWINKCKVQWREFFQVRVNDEKFGGLVGNGNIGFIVGNTGSYTGKWNFCILASGILRREVSSCIIFFTEGIFLARCLKLCCCLFIRILSGKLLNLKVDFEDLKKERNWKLEQSTVPILPASFDTFDSYNAFFSLIRFFAVKAKSTHVSLTFDVQKSDILLFSL